MNAQQIHYVLTLAETGSFSGAARKLFVTQPSLSQYIIALEKQLSAELFDRSTSPVRLTPAGEAFVAAAEQMQAIEETLRNRIADIAGLKTGSLRIGATTFRASCMLPKSIAEFRARFPGISVTVTEDDTQALFQMLKNGELDVLVTTAKADPKLFRAEELARERMYLALPAQSAANAALTDYAVTPHDIRVQSLRTVTAPPIDLRAVRELPFITAQSGEFSAATTAKICGKYGFSPKESLRVRTAETMFSFVTAGLGAALIPDTLVKFGNIAAHPVYYALDEEVSTAAISIVFRKSGYISKAAEQYALLLRRLVDIGTWRHPS
ncbi:MAG: LysR family transcriptional regulator [Oscillospiraceae bacterium]